MQIADLIRYSHMVRELYFDKMFELRWDEVVAEQGLSFGSMRNVFLHLTLVEDRWVNYIIPGKFESWRDPDFESFKDMESLRKYMQEVKENTEKYVAALSAKELSREIEVPWGEKPFAHLAVESVLTHMVMEGMIHYGELSAALWQLGQEAPYMAFWRFQLTKS
jgi:uncharacterized damage-inducible protein DinB